MIDKLPVPNPHMQVSTCEVVLKVNEIIDVIGTLKNEPSTNEETRQQALAAIKLFTKDDSWKMIRHVGITTYRSIMGWLKTKAEQ